MESIKIFDLIQISGSPKSSYKGLSVEEQVYEPASLDVVRGYEKSPSENFTFAVSMVSDSYYAFGLDEEVLELKFKTSEQVAQFPSLTDLLEHIFDLGSEMVKKGEYIEF